MVNEIKKEIKIVRGEFKSPLKAVKGKIDTKKSKTKILMADKFEMLSQIVELKTNIFQTL